mmetsp:Transcript_21405/g.59796  ORF Transcript_21405/g.59796 Transcript_21405/m.59796 type:complete len:463 (+) Transcript_21405:598-1986(+)
MLTFARAANSTLHISMEQRLAPRCNGVKPSGESWSTSALALKRLESSSAVPVATAFDSNCLASLSVAAALSAPFSLSHCWSSSLSFPFWSFSFWSFSLWSFSLWSLSLGSFSFLRFFSLSLSIDADFARSLSFDLSLSLSLSFSFSFSLSFFLRFFFASVSDSDFKFSPLSRSLLFSLFRSLSSSISLSFSFCFSFSLSCRTAFKKAARPSQFGPLPLANSASIAAFPAGVRPAATPSDSPSPMKRRNKAFQKPACSGTFGAKVCASLANWSAVSWPLASKSALRWYTNSGPRRFSTLDASLKVEAQKSKVLIIEGWSAPRGNRPCVKTCNWAGGISDNLLLETSSTAASSRGRQSGTRLIAKTTLISCTPDNSWSLGARTSDARLYNVATPLPTVPSFALATASSIFDASSMDHPGKVMAAASDTASRVLSATVADFVAATMSLRSATGGSVSNDVCASPM